MSEGIPSWINPSQPPPPRKIAIEGNIGAGKTTLAHALAKYLGYKMLEEPVADNTLLAKFYEDTAKYGFLFQLHMLSIRYGLERAGTALVAAGVVPGVVYDRTLAGDTCFAEVNTAFTKHISPEEYRVYLELYERMKWSAPYPDIIMYIEVPVAQLMERINERGRAFELKHVTPEYLAAISEAYSRFVAVMKCHTTVVTFQPAELEGVGDEKVIAAGREKEVMGEVWKKITWLYEQGDHSRFQKRLLRH